MFSYISFRIQTYLGTNGPTGADVPLSIKQTNKQTNKHDSATGLDHIHYQMLKNLPESALDTLLRVFDDSWVTSNFP